MAAPRVEIPEVVLSSSGAPVAGASVQVNLRGSTAATVYAAEVGGATTANPIITDANGRIEGWLEEGSYDLVVSGTGLTTYTQSFEATRGSNSPGKLATTTGDILYASSANNIARLGIGSTGDYLKVSGGLPSWSPVTAQALTQICDLTLGGSQSSFDTNTILGGNIPSTYNHLVIRLLARSDVASTTDNIHIRLNNDTGANYDWERFYGTAGTPTSAETLADTNGVFVGFIPGSTATANAAGELTIRVPNYLGTTFSKAIGAGFTAPFGTTSGTIFSGTAGGKWRTASAVTRLAVRSVASNFIAGSRFTLYGEL